MSVIESLYEFIQVSLAISQLLACLVVMLAGIFCLFPNSPILQSSKLAGSVVELMLSFVVWKKIYGVGFFFGVRISLVSSLIFYAATMWAFDLGVWALLFSFQIILLYVLVRVNEDKLITKTWPIS